jgi:hypothetical protein
LFEARREQVVAIRPNRSGVSRVVRLLAGSSIVLGMTLTGIGMMQSFTNAASAATGQGQLLAGTVGGYSEYSICQGVTGVCSDRGQAAGIDDTGAIAVDGNLEGNQFYVGLGLANSVVVSAEGNVSGTVFIQGSGNVGAYGGSVPAGSQCTPNCTQNPALLPAFGTINSDLTSPLGRLPRRPGGAL